MTLDELLERLSGFEPTGFPFISLYLNAQADENGRTDHDAFLRKEFAGRAKTYPAASAERESFDRDAQRITTYLAQDREPSANGIAIFACAAADDFFEAAQLGAPIENNRLYVYDQPHLYPLARLMDQYPRYAVLVASTNQARIFVFGRGKTLDSKEVQGVKTNRTKVGGWSQMRYQRHLANYHLHHAKEVVDILEQAVRQDGAQHIILAGDEVIMPILREQLPHHLTEMVVDIIKLDIETPEHEILQTTIESLREHDAQTDEEKVARLFDEYRSGGLGVVGVPNTLAALVGGQVEELLINAKVTEIEYSVARVERVLEAYDTEVSASDLDTSETRVVADELIRRAQSSSARVTFIEDPALLAEVGGVGALLRYPMTVTYSENAQRIVATVNASTVTPDDIEIEQDVSVDMLAEVRTAPDNSDVVTEETKNAIIETRTFRDDAGPVERLEVRTPLDGAASIKLFLGTGEVRELTALKDTDALEMTGEELAEVSEFTTVRKASPAPPPAAEEPDAAAVQSFEILTAALGEDKARAVSSEKPSNFEPRTADGDGGAKAFQQRGATSNTTNEESDAGEEETQTEGGIVGSLQQVGEKLEEEWMGFVDRVKDVFKAK